MKKYICFLMLLFALCALPAAAQGPEPGNGNPPCIPPFCGGTLGGALGPKLPYPPDVPGDNICWVFLDIERPRDCTGWGNVAEGCTLGEHRRYWLEWDQFLGCRINCTSCYPAAQGGPISSLAPQMPDPPPLPGVDKGASVQHEEAVRLASTYVPRTPREALDLIASEMIILEDLAPGEQEMILATIVVDSPFEEQIEDAVAAGETLEVAWAEALATVGPADQNSYTISFDSRKNAGAACVPPVNNAGGPYAPQIPPEPDWGYGQGVCFDRQVECAGSLCACQTCCYWIILMPPPLFTVTTYSCGGYYWCAA